MKKIFSILAAVLFAGSMMATEVVFTNADFAGQGTANTGSEVTATKDGVTFTFSKGYSATESLRCYAHGALTISAESTIEKINFTTTGGKNGGLDAEVTVGATTYSVADLASQARFTEIKVTLGGEVPPTPSINYYVAGSMNSWTANPAYKLTANPNAEGEYMGEFTFAANDAFKVIMDNGSETYTWYPDGVDNNYVITEAGDYTVYFRPAGNVEGWYEGFFYVAKAEPVIPDTLSCAQAREAALNGMTDEVTIRGYVTEIVEAWSSYKNVSFWMADTQDGGQVFEAFRVACETAADAPGVGDLVWVKGNLTKYKSTPETKQGGTFGIIEKSQIVPQNLGKKTIEEFLALKNTIDTCILTGVVDSIKNDQYGNLYLSDATAQVYVYGVLTADGQSKKFAELGVEAGDELTILAVYAEYNNAPQVKNAIFVSVTKKDPTAISNTAVEGKAVKALVNGQVLIIKNGKTYNVLGTRVR